MTISDTDRAIQHNPNQTWPTRVMIRVEWVVEGQMYFVDMPISGEEFFGLGGHGAPIDGSALIGRIEQVRRAGPPLRLFTVKGKKNARKK